MTILQWLRSQLSRLRTRSGRLVKSLSPDLKWAIADAPTAAAFGDITSVPTMFIFDRTGKTARVLYGAPPDLHEQAEATLNGLVK